AQHPAPSDRGRPLRALRSGRRHRPAEDRVMAAFRSPGERLARAALQGFCTLGILFLLAPIAAIVPLSFNAESFFTYPMPGLSLRWYAAIAGSGAWRRALVNSLVTGVGATVLATAIGGLAAVGASRLRAHWKPLWSCILISPMIVPGVVTALALFLAYSRLGIAGHRTGIVIAHALLGIPFVVITLTAALAAAVMLAATEGLRRRAERLGVGRRRDGTRG